MFPRIILIIFLLVLKKEALKYMLLQDKVAIVTGATRGIGKAISKEFAKQGASLIINGTNEILLDNLKEELSSIIKSPQVLIGDISDPQTAEKIVATAMEQYHRIDILVNNAGIITREPTEKMRLSDWHRVLEVNLSGTLYLCRKTMPIMKKQKSGKIVNISSRAAKYANPNASPSYGASKAGVIYLTRHLALELGPYGIHVNAVCPGPIETDMTKEWTSSYRKKILENIPLRRLGKPEEVAQTVLFLASDLSDFITGETLNINGGRSMD